jgi:hypothetical protein
MESMKHHRTPETICPVKRTVSKPTALDMFSNKKNPSQALSLTVFLYNHGSSGIKIILSFRAAPSESSDRFRYVMKHPKPHLPPNGQAPRPKVSISS